jgi:hypothetical protein
MKVKICWWRSEISIMYLHSKSWCSEWFVMTVSSSWFWCLSWSVIIGMLLHWIYQVEGDRESHEGHDVSCNDIIMIMMVVRSLSWILSQRNVIGKELWVKQFEQSISSLSLQRSKHTCPNLCASELKEWECLQTVSVLKRVDWCCHFSILFSILVRV